MTTDKAACPFCIASVEGRTPAFAEVIGQARSSEELIYDAPDFMILADIAPIMTGHALIVPKRHQRSIDGWWRHEGAIGRACGAIAALSVSGVRGFAFFEHGIPEREPDKISCIEHAHIHILPVATAVKPALDREGIVLSALVAGEVAEVIADDAQYFVLLDIDGRAYMATENVLPSQFIRRAICQARGETFWNWRDGVDFAVALKTADKISAGRLIYESIRTGLGG